MYNRILLGDLIQSNPSIDIIYDMNIHNIEFKDKKPNTLVLKNKDKYSLKKNCKLVLCAGAIYTPIILQRSGIGKKETLEKANITQISELPVGEKLYDHIGSTVQYMTNEA